MRRFIGASCVASALAVASPAAAQQAAFIDAVAEFTEAIEGAYGDEGARLASALDRMAATLAEWDRSIRAFESEVRAHAASGAQVVDMRLSLGIRLAERGRWDEARRELETASTLDPGRADLHAWSGVVLAAAGRTGDAGEQFLRALARDPGDPVYAYLARGAAKAANDVAAERRARDTLVAAYRRVLDGAALRRGRSPFLRLQPVLDESAETLLLSLAAPLSGYQYLMRRDFEAALQHFHQIVADDPLVTDPASGSRAMTEAAAAMRAGRPADARAWLERGPIHPLSSEAHRVLGLACWVSGDDESSMDHLRIALQRNASNERARLALARVLGALGRDGEAESVLLDTLRVLPTSARAQWWLGDAYQRLNRFADARLAFERAAAGAVAGRSQLYAAIGRMAAAAAQPETAIDAFAGAVAVNPNDPAMHRALAAELLDQDRADDALVEFIAAVLVDAGDARAHAGIGRLHLDSGRHEDALPALRRALELAPGDVQARYALATALMRSGETAAATREFEEVERAQRQLLAEQRRTMTLGVVEQEAALLARDGKIVEAIAKYESAARLGGGPDLYGQLAELYSRAGRPHDAERARAMYEGRARDSGVGQ